MIVRPSEAQKASPQGVLIGLFPQIPSDSSPVLAFKHNLQSPEHSASQQTPSMQTFEAHVSAAEHGDPLA
jgi:hypothetical protein